jgi:proteasome lid subunit RPN8/RPN11
MGREGRRRLVALPRDLARVRVGRPVYDEIRRLAAESAAEVCGGLYGHVEGPELVITYSRACRNFDHSEASFALDVRELTDLPAGLGGAGGLAGVYHSHVAEPARLSPADQYYLSLARWVWLVAGRAAGGGDFEMRCFGRVKSAVEEIAYVVVDEAGG